MFCGECGTDNPDTNKFCKNCGRPLKPVRAGAGPAQAAITPAPAPAVSPGAIVQPPAEGALKRHKFAIGSIVCGVASFAVLPYIFATIAIILGAVAVWKKDYLGLIGILAAVITIAIDLFYFFIF
jgi:hypothetical protein